MKPEVLVFYRYRPTVKPQYQGKFCWDPYTTVEIDEDGDVMLCGCQFHMPYVIGNIYNQSLEDIWHNSEAQKVRQSVLAGEFTYCNWACPKLNQLESTPVEHPVTPNFPSIVKIDLDRSCNLKCPSCRESVIQEKNNARIELQKSIFDQIVSKAKANPNQQFKIYPIGSGEILASHSGLAFLRSLAEYPYQNLDILFSSNGTLLWHHRSMLDAIIDQIAFSVSLDAATQETYAQVRGGDWDAVMQGLEHYQGKILHISFVVQQHNWHEIVDIAKLAQQLGTRVDYQKLENWGHWNPEWWQENNIMDRKKSDFAQALDLLRYVKQHYPRSTFAGGLVNMMNKNI